MLRLASRKRHIRIMFSLLTVAFFLGFAEIFTGIFFDRKNIAPFHSEYFHNSPLFFTELYRPDPLLFWRLQANQSLPDEGIVTNEHGFRGKPIREPKDQNHFRIVCLGDSVTFGFKVQQEQSYPYRLGEMLGNKSGIEVVNAGVPGYSSLQGLRQLKRDVLPLQPDLLIISFGNNDVLDARRVRDSQVPVYRPTSFRIHNWLWQRNITRFIAKTMNRIRGDSSHTTNRCLPEESRANQLAMNRLAEKNGISVVFFHPLHQLGKQKRLANFSLPAEVHEIMVAEAYDEIGASSGNELFLEDNCHPTAEGYVVLADIIANGLKEENRIPH